jgi:hypothetical protein
MRLRRKARTHPRTTGALLTLCAGQKCAMCITSTGHKCSGAVADADTNEPPDINALRVGAILSGHVSRQPAGARQL